MAAKYSTDSNAARLSKKGMDGERDRLDCFVHRACRSLPYLTHRDDAGIRSPDDCADPCVVDTSETQDLRAGVGAINLLLSLWLLNQILTDIYRESALMNWTRWDGRVLFLALKIVALTIFLSKNIRRQVIFIGGYSVGGCWLH